MRELLNFAYDGRFESVSVANYQDLLYAADYTISLRMVQCLAHLKSILFPVEAKVSADEPKLE